MEYLFMFTGLGFLIWVIWRIEAADERTYMRKLNEQREFGFQFRDEEPDPPPKHQRR